MPQKKVIISGMHCRSCELLLEQDLGALPGVKRVEANFQKGQAVIVHEGVSPTIESISEVVTKAGYTVGPSLQLPWYSRNPADFVRILFAVVAVSIIILIIKAFGWNMESTNGSVDIKNLAFLFVLGVTAGVSTCAALVGGVVLALSARYSALHPELSVRERFVPQWWFQLGRVGGFFFFGLLLGKIGLWFSGSIVFTALLTFLVGGVMFFLGLQLTGLFPRLANWSLTLPKSVARSLGFGSEKKYTHTGALLGGAFTFFLPCGFTQAVQLAVIALGQPLFGGIALAVFALGTMPGLLMLGGFASSLTGQTRQWLFPVIAVILIGFGIWNFRNSLHLFGIDSVLPKITSVDSVQTEQAPLEDGVQVVRIVQDASGYHPAVLPTLRVGIPTRLIIRSEESYTCASSFVIPEFGIRKQLQPGENKIEFTPKKTGALPFSCSMGMFRGTIQVQ